MITQQNEVHFSAFLKSTELFLLLHKKMFSVKSFSVKLNIKQESHSKMNQMKNSHLQYGNLVFCSLTDFPPILFQEFFTCVHLHCSSVLGPEYLTELFPEKIFTALQFFLNNIMELSIIQVQKQNPSEILTI